MATKLTKPIQRRIGSLVLEISKKGLRLRRMWGRDWEVVSFADLGKLTGHHWLQMTKEKPHEGDQETID